MDVHTIYANSTNLKYFIGNTVRIVGKVLKISDNIAMVESTDGGQISVTMNRESDYSQATFFEIIGKVQSEIALTEYTSIPLGNDLDLSVVDKVIEAMLKHKDIF
ncbi:hypothetical protein E3Q23_01997 [Wallemia mellicola]|uniref:Replication factor A protein 3 n=1 Tax=Wallemia mellicola TaxID=1708541 RepID=A0A4T0TKJ7_9BASI|nr:hypothetical protein E3Q24_02318 [Wallemia mellicola]TIB76081.1 hypothetical protein E3Q23_01997 [Wallemia mellicola]TIB83829.1 hypothetical protein E3Q21_02709 [Wallemia mellicola]TIB86801.1 hypothetical protein E3Q20_02701 [Wallemia mellicola]TIC06418.1 hypothetical protein E3Q16_01214 [Wallemia mellicola]